jgi:hypothetical protein
MVQMRNADNILVRKPEWTKPLRRPSSRWENNVCMDIKEIGWEVVDWIHLAPDREQWRAHARNGNESLGSTKAGNS